MAASFAKQSSNSKGRKKAADRRSPAEIAGGGQFCLPGPDRGCPAINEAFDPPH
jgi:hypothetical protein